MIRRRKLGILVPSSNVTMEYEMPMMAPQGVSFHFSRIPQTEDTEEQLEAMIDYVPEKSNLLAHARVDAIAFGCTSGSFVKGMGYDKKVIEAIIVRKGKGDPLIVINIRKKLVFKGINPAKYTYETIDDPVVLRKLMELARDLGFKI